MVTNFDDPMQIYMRHLATQKGKRSSSGPRPKQATEIVRIKKEVGADAQCIQAPPPVPEPVSPPRRVVDEMRGRLLSEAPSEFFTKVKNRR